MPALTCHRSGPGALSLRPINRTVIVVVGLDAAAQMLRDSGGLGDRQEAAFPAVPRRRRGRPKSGFSEQRLTEVMRLYFVEKLSMRQVADVVGVSHMSVYRMLSDPNVELLI